MATFNIEINGISQSVNAVDNLINRLDSLEDRIESISNDGIDTTDLRQSLESMRRSLTDNVDNWEELAEQIEEATDNVEQLERAYRRLDNPLDASEVREYARAVDEVADNVDRIGDINVDTTQAVRNVENLNNSLRSAEEMLGNGFNINIGGMSLQFDDVNQAIGVLEDHLYNLQQRGQTNTQMFRDITDEIVRLRSAVITVDDAIDNTLSGGINNLVRDIGSITSLVSIGEGISGLFGIEDDSINQTIQRFASLSLVLQGISELQQQLTNQTSLASRGFQLLGQVANPVVEGIATGFNRVIPIFSRFNEFANGLRALDLTRQMREFATAAMLDDQLHSGWNILNTQLSSISNELSGISSMTGLRDLAEQFADISGITREIQDAFDAGLINEDQYNRANDALRQFSEGLSDDAVQAGRLREQLSSLGVIVDGMPPALTRTQRALITVSRGIRAVGTAIKALLKATIILAAIQAAIEAISWVTDKVVKLFKQWAGDETLVSQLNTTTQALNALNESLNTYISNLDKLSNTKVISEYTKLTQSVRQYENALKQVLATQQAINKTNVKSLSDNLSTNNTWFTGANIKNVADFTKQFEILQKAVQAGTDRFKALKGETEEVQKQFGGNWLQRFWNTAGDAKADYANAQKAVISDIQNQINNLDLSKGTEELEKFIKLLDTPMYSVSLANIENLFPEDEYAKVLAANIQKIKEYYKNIKDLQNQAEVEAQKNRDAIKQNNISAIRDRLARERAEFENGYQLELRDAADNEELKKSITNKYHTQKIQLLKQQAAEIRGVQDVIRNNEIESMREGLDKQLALLEQNRQQEIASAKDNEILVGETIISINKKYDKLVLDAKKQFYKERQELLVNYTQQFKDIQAEIARIEYEIATSKIQNRSKDQMEALGFTEESIENIRQYYDKVRDISNTEAQKIAEANKEMTQLETDNSLNAENNRNAERLRAIEEDYKNGLLTVEEYNKAIQDAKDQHYQMMDAITRKGEQDLINIEKQYQETAKNNNITAINERIAAINDAYSDINTNTKVNSLGIIDYTSTKNELNKAKGEYTRILGEIAIERDNLQKSFDKNEISFGDFRQANKELDDLEKSVQDSSKQVALDLTNLFSTTIQSINQYVGQFVGVLGDIWSTYNDIQMARIEQQQELLEAEYDMLEEQYSKQEELTQKHTDKLADINEELKDSRGDRRAHLIEQLNAERAAQLASLQEEQKIQKEKEANQKKQDQLEKQRREQEKKNSIVQATINTYTAVTNALAVPPWFVGLALSAVALAMGMAQIAQIKKQKYADGGLLVGRSHSQGGIPVGNTGIEVEGNEYIINKYSTSKNLPLIDYINNNRRSLTKEDLIRFYDSGKSNVSRVNKGKYADGGLLPNINLPNTDNTIVIQDDRPIVAQIVDIVNSADNYRQIQVLAGLSGDKIV